MLLFRYFLPLFILLSDTFSAAAVPLDADMRRVRTNVLAAVAKSSEKQARELMDTQRPDGSWPDINYQDKGRSVWQPGTHAARLLTLASAYREPTGKLYKNKTLSRNIHLGMNFWFKGNFVCPNWWYNQIGVPRTLGSVFLLMQDEMNAEETASALKYMSNAKFGMTGQNSVWLATNVLTRALLQNDEKLLFESRNYIVRELRVNSDGEGIRPDMSFHQHGPQQQFGNYGLGFSSSLSHWAQIFRGTKYAISKEQLGILHDYLLEGLQWVCWRGYMEIGSCGRQFSPGAQSGKANSVNHSLHNMLSVDPEHAREYQRALALNNRNAKENTLLGNRFFNYSDYGVHRTKNWFAGLKMSSTRTIGSEIVNAENLLGMNLGSGALFVYRRGDEYENIFPVWDWAQLPGTTFYKTDTLFPKNPTSRTFRNKHDFAGGVSGGTSGIAALVLNNNGLGAQKSYFFLDDSIVCMGSGITAKKGFPVATVVEQKNKRGVVGKAKFGGTVGKTDDFYNGVYHDGIAYYSAGKFLTITDGRQTGNWRRVARFLNEKPVESEVFKLNLEHGASPGNESYFYIIFPDVTLENWKQKVIRNGTEVLEHRKQLHAIRKGDAVQAVFFEPGTLTLPRGFESADRGRSAKVTLSADTPCIVQLKKGNVREWICFLSEPTQKLDKIILRLSGQWRGEFGRYDEGKKETLFAIPVVKLHGKTVRLLITRENGAK